MKKIILILLLTLFSCTRIDKPPEVAGKFWKSMAKHNIEEARKYAVEGSMENVTFLGNSKIEISNISDKADIMDNRAAVYTKLKITDKNGKARYYEFDTVLTRVDNLWKVDFDKTRTSIITYHMKDFGDSLKEMGRALGGAMEEMGKAMKDAFNDAKENLKKDDKKKQ